MFNIGDIDFLQLTTDQFLANKSRPEFKMYDSGAVTFIIYSQKGTSEDRAKILRNRNFQMALSYAIDRQDLVDALYPMNYPSTVVINPAISNPLGGKWDDYSKAQGKYFKVHSDLVLAKEYLSKACKELGYNSASQMPAFDFIATNNAINRSTLEYLQDTWQKTLGIKVVPRLLDYAQFWENLYGAPYDICWSGWGPDYDDPFTYLDMWDSRGGWNKTGWIGKNYYETLDKANQQTDPKARCDLLVEAERILLTEAPIMPLMTRRASYLLRSNKIPDMYINMFGILFDFRYAHLAN
jgi:oligopeptide transport system substrate-binding protein